MTIPARVKTIRLLLGWWAVVLSIGAVAASAEEADYHRFPRTVSPDGAYVLAWSDSLPEELEAQKTKGKEETVEETETANFLVDLATKKPVLLLPDFHYYAGEDGRQNHYDLDAAWSPDARTLLAVYDARWNYASIVWVDPVARKCTDVGKKLEALFRRALLAREGKGYRKYAEGMEVSFQNVVFETNRTLIMDAWAQRIKKEPTFHYRMRVRAVTKDGGVQFETLEARAVSDDLGSGGGGDETIETDLNKSYNKLRGRLPEAEREALKQQQLLWLKQREVMEDEFDQLQFTRRRLLDFNVRLQALAGK